MFVCVSVRVCLSCIYVSVVCVCVSVAISQYVFDIGRDSQILFFASYHPPRQLVPNVLSDF